MQNITRDIEIQNKLIVTRGEVGEDNGGEKGEGLSRNMYKGHMDKSKTGLRWRVGSGDGWRGSGEGKWRQLYLNNNKK